jgi:hypothetical protein
MEMTRCTSGDSLSQGLKPGCYEPSTHCSQAVIIRRGKLVMRVMECDGQESPC